MPSTDQLSGNGMGAAHAKLFANLRALQEVATNPSADVATVQERLNKAGRDLAEHFRLEEEGGYLEAVRQRDPRLNRAIGDLLKEHRTIVKSLDELTHRDGRLRHVVDLRDGIMAWIASVRRHERHENTLVQDAFNVDLAGEG